jgi:hypothetical protein
MFIDDDVGFLWGKLTHQAKHTFISHSQRKDLYFKATNRHTTALFSGNTARLND